MFGPDVVSRRSLGERLLLGAGILVFLERVDEFIDSFVLGLNERGYGGILGVSLAVDVVGGLLGGVDETWVEDGDTVLLPIGGSIFGDVGRSGGGCLGKQT